jgi:hypothetical protein
LGYAELVNFKGIQLSQVSSKVQRSIYDRNFSLKILKETANVICIKKRYCFRNARLYEREVTKKQKLFIRWQKLPYYTTGG